MTRPVARWLIALIAMLAVAACVPRGQLRSAIEAERRAQAQERRRLEVQVDSLRRALATQDAAASAARAALEQFRTEFGARITAMESTIEFALPITFGVGEATLRTAQHAGLARTAQVIARYYPGALVAVRGYADRSGSGPYNRRLSKRRADAVADYMRQRGLGNVVALGYGATFEVAPGAVRDAPRAAANRRVVIAVEAAGAKVEQ